MDTNAAAGILEILNRGELAVAATAIAGLSTGDIGRYVLTALALQRSGDRARAQAILQKVNLQELERFVAGTVEHFDKVSADALLEHCFLRAPTTREQAPSISIFSFPKSGSTFLETILRNYTGMAVTTMTSANDHLGTSLDTLVFEQAVRGHQIARGHLVADARCITRCVAYDLRPVFLHRNVFDSLLSYVDHFQRKYRPYSYVIPDPATGLDAAVLQMAFHYVEMFASWSHFARRSGAVLVLAYEDNRADWAGAARRVLEHSGIPVDEQRLNQALAKSNEAVTSDPHSVRYSQGGRRDRSQVDPDTMARVRRLYRLFPEVDFTPVDDGAGQA